MSDTSPLMLHGLTKRFGYKLAVDNVSLELHEGEVFGFLGPNGAGKSTTIRSVMDFLRPTDGWVELLGGRNSKERTALHDRVGYLAGDIALYETMTGRKLLKFLTRMGRRVDWRYVDELAGRFEAALDRPIRQLSKGNRQKIGLIQAFMHRPKLLILDEPTKGFDPVNRKLLMEIIEEQNRRGATVIMVTHQMEEVEKICDRALLLKNGKKEAYGTINEIRDKYGKNRIIIEFSGKLPNSKKFNIITSEANYAELEPLADSQEILQELAKEIKITKFSVEKSTLNEIFLEIYGEQNEEMEKENA